MLKNTIVTTCLLSGLVPAVTAGPITYQLTGIGFYGPISFTYNTSSFVTTEGWIYASDPGVSCSTPAIEPCYGAYFQPALNYPDGNTYSAIIMAGQTGPLTYYDDSFFFSPGSFLRPGTYAVIAGARGALTVTETPEPSTGITILGFISLILFRSSRRRRARTAAPHGATEPAAATDRTR